MEHKPIQFYQTAIGMITIDDLSNEQVALINILIDDLELNEISIFKTFLGFDYHEPVSASKIVAFLERLASIIHHSNDEIECTIRTIDALFQFFRIEDGRLITHYGRVVKGAWQVLTEMPTRHSASELKAYDGQLCLTPFQPVYQKIVDYLHIRQPGYVFEIIDEHCLNFKYGGRDSNCYHVEILMKIASIVGEDVQ